MIHCKFWPLQRPVHIGTVYKNAMFCFTFRPQPFLSAHCCVYMKSKEEDDTRDRFSGPGRWFKAETSSYKKGLFSTIMGRGIFEWKSVAKALTLQAKLTWKPEEKEDSRGEKREREREKKRIRAWSRKNGERAKGFHDKIQRGEKGEGPQFPFFPLGMYRQ